MGRETEDVGRGEGPGGGVGRLCFQSRRHHALGLQTVTGASVATHACVNGGLNRATVSTAGSVKRLMTKILSWSVYAEG
eukprot:86855-Chlamydomonas_euryale.AAC.4